MLAPHDYQFIAELKAVSDEWLTVFDKKEMIFSQGQFDAVAIAEHDVIMVEDDQAKVVSFLNIIPDFTEGSARMTLLGKWKQHLEDVWML